MRSIILVALLMFTLCLFADEASLKQDISKCKYKDANACHLVAIYYYGNLSDTKKAVPFFQSACELGEPVACYTAAYINGQKQDSFLFYLDKACKLQYNKACTDLEKLKPGVK